MNRKHMRIVGPVALAATLSIFGAMALISRAAEATQGVSAKQLSAIVSGKPIPATEEATLRDPRRGKPTEPAADAAITAHAKTTVAGEAWKIVSYRSKSGALCAGVTWPGEGQEMGCATMEEWFAHGPVSVSVGARQAHGRPLTWQTFVLSGLVDLNRVQKLELVSTDCSKRDISLDSGGFLLDITTSGLIARGIWPYEVLGEDGNGRVVQRINVKPNRPDTDAAKAAGIKAPTVGAGCG